MFKFNVGAAVQGIDNSITRVDVLSELYFAGFNDVRIAKIEQSTTESTYVVTAAGFSTWLYDTHQEAIDAACKGLQQDCIAYKLDSEGFLIGPKAQDWGGAFNPEYFIN